MDWMLQLLPVLASGVGAYVSARVGIERALTLAKTAKVEAARAHRRLDDLILRAK